jgi:hypothetical protein
MVSLVLTIIAFAGAMGVPAFLTAIVESAFKIRPPSSRTRASRRMDWTDRYRPVAIAMTSTKRTSIGQSPACCKAQPNRRQPALIVAPCVGRHGEAQRIRRVSRR